MTQTQLLTSQHLQRDEDRPFENKCCVVNATDMRGHVEALAGWQDVMGCRCAGLDTSGL